MSGLYSPGEDYVLVARIRDNAACVIQSYLKIDGGKIDEAVTDLMARSTWGLAGRPTNIRASRAGDENNTRPTTFGGFFTERRTWHKAQ
ncbi:hypothetical protein ACQPW1_30355 [Nocardia sp. CA-128927]|uniref:hypothetical protein n=1 Tax=Nocardia sp. CA-128927 TaxID=3239975 RepID=UPI003D97848F